MTDLIAAARAREAAATPGPWKGNSTFIWRAGDAQLDADIAANKGSAGPIIASEHRTKSGIFASTYGERGLRGSNAAFIVAARNDYPLLLDVLEAAKSLADWYDAPPYVYQEEDLMAYIDRLRAAIEAWKAAQG